MKGKLIAAAAAVVASVAGSWPEAADAQQRGLHVTGHLQGYTCMMLGPGPTDARGFEEQPPILAEPRRGAPEVGLASASVIVADPLRVVNGYAQVLHLDGRPGWLRREALLPWANRNSPGARCVPAMMSNGRLGFDYSPR